MSSHCQLHNDSHQIVLESYPDSGLGNNIVFLLYNSGTTKKCSTVHGTRQSSQNRRWVPSIEYLWVVSVCPIISLHGDNSHLLFLLYDDGHTSMLSLIFRKLFSLTALHLSLHRFLYFSWCKSNLYEGYKVILCCSKSCLMICSLVASHCNETGCPAQWDNLALRW